jgi:phenylacetate-CoA ligase
MLIIRGVNVFPSQIESVLMETEDVEPHYQLEVDREDNLDVLTVKVEVGDRSFTDEVKGLQSWSGASPKTSRNCWACLPGLNWLSPKPSKEAREKRFGLWTIARFDS